MKKASMFTICLACTSIIATAQTEQQRRQNMEYKSLSAATQRAFTVPDRPAPSTTYKSSITNTAASSSSSNSTSGSTSSGVFTSNNYGWADYSHINRQKAAEAKGDARIAAFEAKMLKFENLITQRKLIKNKSNYQAIYACALDAGLDAYTAGRMIGFNATEYKEMLDRKAARDNPKPFNLFNGSTKSLCEGACEETLYYNDRSGTYVGNTKNGRPHGKGILTLSNGDKFIGNFEEGNLLGDIVLNFADGNKYEGGFFRGEFFGEGKFTFTDGEINEGTFKNNKLNGFARIVKPNYTTTGFYKNGQEEKRGERMYEFTSKTIKIINYDNPTLCKIIWVADGMDFVGTFDESTNYKKGKMNYSKTSFFNGEFNNGKHYKGVYETEEAIFEGTFNSKGKKLLVGKTIDKKTKAISESFYNELGQKNGYRIDYTATGGINEAIYENDTNVGPIKYTNINGDLLIGITGYKDYDLYGFVKDKTGKMKLGALQNGSWITLPESERENVMKIFEETNIALAKGRADYEAAMK